MIENLRFFCNINLRQIISCIVKEIWSNTLCATYVTLSFVIIFKLIYSFQLNIIVCTRCRLMLSISMFDQNFGLWFVLLYEKGIKLLSCRLQSWCKNFFRHLCVCMYWSRPLKRNQLRCNSSTILWAFQYDFCLLCVSIFSCQIDS